jgi:hypothetical protein
MEFDDCCGSGGAPAGEKPELQALHDPVVVSPDQYVSREGYNRVGEEKGRATKHFTDGVRWR